MDEFQQGYGSAQLTPEVIRNARFPNVPGTEGLDPRHVYEFLEQVASAMEVLGSSDVVQGMRRELMRNSEISSRVVLAGQETAERLRQQAADDARAIIEDTKRMAEQLRDAARGEVERTRQHVDELRRAFIDELRDMYDRVGATLYRFETASKVGAGIEPPPADATPAATMPAEPLPPVEEAAPAGFAAPGQDVWGAPSTTAPPPAPETGPEPAPASGGWGDLDAWGDTDAESGGAEAPGPAWSQLPAEAYHNDDPEVSPFDDTPGAAEQRAVAAADGDDDEPLVDLRGFGEPEEPATQASTGGDELGGSWLSGDDEPHSESAAGPPPAADGGSWLDTGDDAEAAAVEPGETPDTDEENRRAEALITGMGEVLERTGTEQEGLPEPPSLSPEGGSTGQVDMAALRTFVLEAIHEGQPRPAIEDYLRDNFDVADPGPLVTALLEGTAPAGPGDGEDAG